LTYSSAYHKRKNIRGAQINKKLNSEITQHLQFFSLDSSIKHIQISLLEYLEKVSIILRLSNTEQWGQDNKEYTNNAK